VTLRRFHDEFHERGLDITFTSRGRPSRPGYPTERELYLATDLEGGKGSYLVTEERFRTVRDLERRDGVIPAVGDLSGPTAMKAIAGYLREINLPVSAFYLSNVEMYLFRGGTFPQFAENVKALPATASSVLIRSYFGRGVWSPRNDPAGTLPQVVPGQLSAQQLQTIRSFVQLTAKPETVTYWDVLTFGAVDLRAPKPRRRRSPTVRLSVRPSVRPR
jgi:hypothetical protein